MTATYQVTAEDMDTLVELARAHATDPLGVALILYIESAGFDPQSQGPSAAQVSGLNQMKDANLASFGLTRAQWLGMTAAEQLPYIFQFWASLAQTFAGGQFPTDGQHLLALNFLPKSYEDSGAATNPDAVIAGKAGPYASQYAPAAYYDPDGTGTITPNTIARRMLLVNTNPPARWGQVRAALQAAVVRAGSLPPSAPSSGSTAPPKGSGAGGGLIAILFAVGLAWASMRGRGGA